MDSRFHISQELQDAITTLEFIDLNDLAKIAKDHQEKIAQTVQHQFKLLALKYHPDRNPDTTALMQKISASAKLLLETKNIIALENEIERLSKLKTKKNDEDILIKNDRDEMTAMSNWTVSFTKNRRGAPRGPTFIYKTDTANTNFVTAIAKYGHTRISKINGKNVLKQHITGNELPEKLKDMKLIGNGDSKPQQIISSQSTETHRAHSSALVTQAGNEVTIECASSDSNSTLNVLPRSRRPLIECENEIMTKHFHNKSINDQISERSLSHCIGVVTKSISKPRCHCEPALLRE